VLLLEHLRGCRAAGARQPREHRGQLRSPVVAVWASQPGAPRPWPAPLSSVRTSFSGDVSDSPELPELPGTSPSSESVSRPGSRSRLALSASIPPADEGLRRRQEWPLGSPPAARGSATPEMPWTPAYDECQDGPCAGRAIQCRSEKGAQHWGEPAVPGQWRRKKGMRDARECPEAVVNQRCLNPPMAPRRERDCTEGGGGLRG